MERRRLADILLISAALFNLPRHRLRRCIKISGCLGQIKRNISQTKKSQPLRLGFLFCGGGKRDRTADLLHAMQALYQLSYTPEIWWRIRDSNPGHKDYDSSALTD